MLKVGSWSITDHINLCVAQLVWLSAGVASLLPIAACYCYCYMVQAEAMNTP